ncbi:thioesterase II family protein [Streptomyces coriariae]|uniref:thioesterase II family protein n=1 Tax=Streptomyces coriariae TaxID=2864460 RepID=UPI001E4F3A5B|nr:alpha/beta fold hydrolase [Streptomyces coriariae]
MSDEPPVLLHCFAHAAEGADVFENWAESTGPGVTVAPVLLPGCASRRTEARLTTHEALLADVLPRFVRPRPGPYVLFGHGLGAMIALTVTRALHEAGLPGPALLSVDAWTTPHLSAVTPDPRGTTDAELLHLLDADGAIPPRSDEGIWLRAVLPALRADLELAHALHDAACRPLSTGPLTTPVLVIAAQDSMPAPLSAADGWHPWTTGPVRSRTVPGRHLFAPDSRRLPRLLGRACRVADRLTRRATALG